MNKGLLLVLSLLLVLPLLALLFVRSGVTLANAPQATATVEVVNNAYNPDPVEIEVGDTVQWTNVQGFHDVKADDNSFSSGDPRAGTWVFTHTFTLTGTFLYYCSVHGGRGGAGMAGQVIVRAARDESDVIFLPIVSR